MDPSVRRHAYDLLRWNTPLARSRVPAFATALGLDDAGRARAVTDLGCGWGQLLIDLVVSSGGASGMGVDSDEALVARARENTKAAGLSDRIRFEMGDLREVHGLADVVIAIGVAHVWGSTFLALEALRRQVAPGGRVLYGDGGWTGAPTPSAVQVLGEGIEPLAAIAVLARAAGWDVVEEWQAGLAEWDTFEDRWCAGLEAFADSSDDPAAATDARALAAEHREGYHNGYRGQLGFTYLVLTAA